MFKCGNLVAGYGCRVPVFRYDGGKKLDQLSRTTVRNIDMLLERLDRRFTEYVCQDIGHCWSPCWIKVVCCFDRGMSVFSRGIVPEVIRFSATFFHRFDAC